MNDIKNNEKNKSVVILNPERSEWVSRSHVTSVEIVVNDEAKTKPHHALRRSLRALAYGSTLKMTEKALSFLRLHGASDIVGIRNVITRRTLVRRGYLPEQGTHANKESLFASVTWLMRLPRRIQRMLLVMTIPTLALLFTIATTAESRADDSATTAEDTTQTQESQKLLTNEGKCGNGCLYQITTDSTTGKRNLRVYNAPSYTGVANIANEAFAGNGYDPSNNYHEYHNNATFDKITIDGDFDTIGRNAFWRNGASEVVFNGNIKNIVGSAFEYNNFTSVDLPEGLQRIGGEAFYGNSISSITIPDSVTNIGSYAFHGGNVTDVYISDSINDIGTGYTFGSKKRPDIFCKGDELKCKSLVKNIHDANTESAGLENYVTGVDKDHCTGEKYFWNGTGCSRKESYCDKDMYYSGYECRMRPTDGSEITCDYEYSGWVKVGNNCYSPEVTYAKKHYTPAEANQWLRDGNDNFVVLTFKK